MRRELRHCEGFGRASVHFTVCGAGEGRGPGLCWTQDPVSGCMLYGKVTITMVWSKN